MPQTIRDTIKVIRKERGVTQKVLANELGIYGHQVGELENGKRSSLSEEKLEFILDYLNIEWKKSDIRQLRGEEVKALTKKS